MQYYDVSNDQVVRTITVSGTEYTMVNLKPGHTYKASLVAVRNQIRSNPVMVQDILYTRMSISYTALEYILKHT